MARKFLKRIIPDPEWVRKQKSLRFLGEWLHDPNIWHLNRNSVSKAAFIGLFMAFMPLPTQMILAAGAALLFRANLPVAVSLVWVSNPITMPAIFYLAYRVGIAITGADSGTYTLEMSWEWVSQALAHNWLPFLLGCLVCGIFFGLLASALLRVFWRWYVIRRWHERRLKRLARQGKR